MKWLTTKDIAERSGLSPHTIKSYLHRELNEIPQPNQYFNRTPVWAEEDIAGWINSRKKRNKKTDPQPPTK